MRKSFDWVWRNRFWIMQGVKFIPSGLNVFAEYQKRKSDAIPQEFPGKKGMTLDEVTHYMFEDFATHLALSPIAYINGQLITHNDEIVSAMQSAITSGLPWVVKISICRSTAENEGKAHFWLEMSGEGIYLKSSNVDAIQPPQLDAFNKFKATFRLHDASESKV